MRVAGKAWGEGLITRHALLLSLATTLASQACDFDFLKGFNPFGTRGGPGTSSPACKPPTTLTVSPANALVEVGRGVALRTALDTVSTCPLLWVSSDTAVAVVSFTHPATHGTVAVVGVGPGNATVTAATSDRTAAATISVVAPTTAFVAVSASSGHTCALASDGSTYCWGDEWATAPVRVPGDVGFASLSGGRSWSCGLSSEGVAYCWGPISPWGGPPGGEPVRVGEGLVFVSLDAGRGNHVCALTAAGAAWCWEVGYLGDFILPMVPELVGSGPVFSNVTAGGTHSCGLTPQGAAYCWGSNYNGQLGIGVADTVFHAAPVSVAGGLSFRQVSAGVEHTCGITLSGAAYCWGRNNRGQLGAGDTLPTQWPRAVARGVTFASVSASEDNTCGISTSGDGYCWGLDGSTWTTTKTDQLWPVKVDFPLRWRTLSAGLLHACGLADDRVVYCWGLGTHGQLGVPLSSSPTPVRVAGQP